MWSVPLPPLAPAAAPRPPDATGPWEVISGYHFVAPAGAVDAPPGPPASETAAAEPAPDLPGLRDRLHAQAAALGLCGTILLAEEGLNFSLAGRAGAPQRWLEDLRRDRRFATLRVHRQLSPMAPFARLRVRIKPEVIRMNRPQVRPGLQRAATVSPQRLARWIQTGEDDQGRPLVLLDTRNRFEVEAGRFAGAVDLGLSRFSDLPDAALAQAGRWRGHTVVSYCTGGIRCEKAALWLSEALDQPVLQLDGGILGYFSALPTAPGWEGRCVVFDDRQSVLPPVAPRDAA